MIWGYPYFRKHPYMEKDTNQLCIYIYIHRRKTHTHTVRWEIGCHNTLPETNITPENLLSGRRSFLFGFRLIFQGWCWLVLGRVIQKVCSYCTKKLNMLNSVHSKYKTWRPCIYWTQETCQKSHCWSSSWVSLSRGPGADDYAAGDPGIP